MTVGNTRTSWGLAARVFHWLVLAMIAVQIPLGFWMVEVYEVYSETWGDDTWVMRTSNWHHTLGFLVLAVACARLSWRALNPTPELPQSLPLWQRALARSTHVVLYALLFIYPLTGCVVGIRGRVPDFFHGLRLGATAGSAGRRDRHVQLRVFCHHPSLLLAGGRGGACPARRRCTLASLRRPRRRAATDAQRCLTPAPGRRRRATI